MCCAVLCSARARACSVRAVCGWVCVCVVFPARCPIRSSFVWFLFFFSSGVNCEVGSKNKIKNGGGAALLRCQTSGGCVAAALAPSDEQENIKKQGRRSRHTLHSPPTRTLFLFAPCKKIASSTPRRCIHPRSTTGKDVTDALVNRARKTTSRRRHVKTRTARLSREGEKKEKKKKLAFSATTKTHGTAAAPHTTRKEGFARATNLDLSPRVLA